MTTLSACLIVRDEEKNLAACLASLRPYVDEICVLDTGSKDGTVAVAQSLADRVESFEWCADFSAARNRAAELATGEWILSVDADEELDAASGSALRAAIQDATRQAWLVTVASELGGGKTQSTALPRLFRNRPEIRWNRTVHESVMDSLITLGASDLADSGVVLRHSGYVGEAVGRKRVRNLMLLRKRAMEAPEDLYNTYKLAATLRDADQTAEQLSTFEVAHRLAEAVHATERATYPFLPLVYEGFAACLIKAGRLGHAARVLDSGLVHDPECSELLLRKAELALALGSYSEAAQNFAACGRNAHVPVLYPRDPRTTGVEPILGHAWATAETGDVQTAIQLTERALQVDPDHLGAQCLEVRLQLATAESAEQGLRALERMTHRHPEAQEVQLLAGEVALARGDRDTAGDLWRAAAQHGNTQAAVRFLINELALGRTEKAAAQLPQLPASDLASAACSAVVSIVAGIPFQLDDAFDSQRVLAAVVPWLRELVDAPVHTALEAFAANARLYALALPGVESLLVADEEAPAAALPTDEPAPSSAA